MGRYFSGDVEGKFWFAVQPSDIHEQFGAKIQDPSFIDYIIENGPQVLEGLEALECKLGKYLEVAHQFFEQEEGYTETMFMDFAQTYGMNCKNVEVVKQIIRDYADWTSGIQVLEYFNKTKADACYISAEL